MQDQACCPTCTDEFLKKSTPWVVESARGEKSGRETETSFLYISVTSVTRRKRELLLSNFTSHQKSRPYFSTAVPQNCSLHQQINQEQNSAIALSQTRGRGTRDLDRCKLLSRKEKKLTLAERYMLLQQDCFLFLTYLVHKVTHLLLKSVELSGI